jgi:hypothetical protein
MSTAKARENLEIAEACLACSQYTNEDCEFNYQQVCTDLEAALAVVDAAKRLGPGSWEKGHPGAVAYRSRWVSEASYKEFVDALAKFEEVCGEDR